MEPVPPLVGLAALLAVVERVTVLHDGTMAKWYSYGGAETDCARPRPSQGSPANTRVSALCLTLT